MKKAKFQRVIALALTVALLLCGGVISVSADNNTATDGSSAAELKALLNAISYNDYIAMYSDSTDTENFVPTATTGVTISGLDGVASDDISRAGITEEQWNALSDAEKLNYAFVETYDGTKGLYIPGKGDVTWTLDTAMEKYAALATAGRYYIEIDYYPVANKSTSIERIFMINNAVPFAEARYLTISKIWKNEYPDAEFAVPEGESADTYLKTAAEAGITATSKVVDGKTYIVYNMPKSWTAANANVTDTQALRFFTKDIDLNEIRASMEQRPSWATYQFKDSNGFIQTPFEFVVQPDETGKVTLTLESVNEPIVISEIRLIPPSSAQSYADYRAQYQNIAAGEGQIKIEAEYYSAASSQTIYPVSDNTSAATSPSSSRFTVLNTVGGDKWQTPGQWIEYTFSVDKTGMYKIATRFRQSILDGMYTSRVLSIYGGNYDGIPFAEASKLQFNYSSDWQSGYLTDGTTEFEFYFEEGVEYTLRFEVSLGHMGEIVSRVQTALNSINADYLNILKLTGASPDEDRDYGFSSVMPDVMRDMIIQKQELEAISKILVEEAGVKSSMTADLDKISRLLGTMGYSDSEVAPNLSQLKSYIGTLGTWLSDAKTQPLTLDFLVVQPDGAELPKAKAGFWEALVYEFSGFFQSFFRNYDRVGAMSVEEGEDTIEVWLAYGRDQAQVIRGLVNNDFTKNQHVPVNLKLVSGGTLLPSILSGQGPDVYIGIGQGDVINYAIRGALLPIEGMEGFAEVKADFNESAMMVLGIEDSSRTHHYYGLPETQSFSMMFVRKDILADLNIDVPKTWDDVKAAIPVLQANNMMIGMQNDMQIFLYQMGGELFADGGMRINLDSNVALEAFETMCDLYTMYSFPYSYDFANRFRTGEMPIGFANYTATYNHLKVFATEIEGLWEFRPLPGYYDEEGNLNNQAVSSVSAIVMITGCENTTGAWKFMKWHSGAQCQIDYSNEMVAILGPSAKHPTANRHALASLPWTSAEYEQLQAQFDHLAAIPNYPGAYIVGRYTNFAFLAAYNDGANPVTELQSYINTINKEITRKRTEFELETLDYVGQTLAEKRMREAETKLNELKTSSDYNAAYDAACNNALTLMKDYTTEDYASLRSLADELEALNKDFFASAVADMRDAANALETYENYK